MSEKKGLVKNAHLISPPMPERHPLDIVSMILNQRRMLYVQDAEDLRIMTDERQLYEQSERMRARATRATNARDVRGQDVHDKTEENSSPSVEHLKESASPDGTPKNS